MLDRELKKGSTDLLILAVVDGRPRHGYEIAKLIEQRSGGRIQFYAASLYPRLYRLEKRGLLQGRWVEKAGERRRRFYRVTPRGSKTLIEERNIWRDFAAAMNNVVDFRHA